MTEALIFLYVSIGVFLLFAGVSLLIWVVSKVAKE